MVLVVAVEVQGITIHDTLLYIFSYDPTYLSLIRDCLRIGKLVLRSQKVTACYPKATLLRVTLLVARTNLLSATHNTLPYARDIDSPRSANRLVRQPVTSVRFVLFLFLEVFHLTLSNPAAAPSSPTHSITT